MSLTIYASNCIDTIHWSVLKNSSSVMYCVVADCPVTWLILICWPSLGFGARFSRSRSLDETSEMFEPESITIEVVGPSIALIQIVALEGWAPMKVVPGGRPVTGLSCITSVLKVLASVDPKPLAPRAVLVRRVVSMSAYCDSGRNSNWAIACAGRTWYGASEWLWRRIPMVPL